MKTLTPALAALLADPVASAQLRTADLYTITLSNGPTLRWSSLDVDVIFNGQTYARGPQRVNRSAIVQKRGLKSDKLDIKVASRSTDVVAFGLSLNQLLVAGLFDGATVRIDRIFNPVPAGPMTYSVDATPYGSAIVWVGFVADVKIELITATLTCTTVLELLNQKLPIHVWEPDCRWVTYGAGCTLNAADYTVATAAEVGSTPSLIVVPALTVPVGIPHAGLPVPDGWFDQGSVVFTGGQNSGLSRSVQSYIGAGNLQNYANAVLEDSPVAFFRFNEPAGATVVHDALPTGYTGAVNGGVTFGVPGALNSGTLPAVTAAAFDGSTGYIVINMPSPATLPNNGGAVTFECWVKPNASPANGIFDTSGGALGLQCFAPAGFGLSASAVEWGNQSPIAGFGLPIGAWSHLVCVFSGGRYIHVYVNGVYAAGGSAALGDKYGWGALIIGRVVAFTKVGIGAITAYFGGSLEEFAVYNYPLSAGQVQTHFKVGSTAPTATAQGAITLVTPLPFAPAVGDTFKALAGDDRMQTTCARKFNNLANFGGVPFFPANDAGI